MTVPLFRCIPAVAALLVCAGGGLGQDVRPAAPPKPLSGKWVTATGKAAGATITAQDEAVAKALRNAVEQACGVFLTAQTKTQDYKAVYNRVFADTVGYVVRHKTPRIWVQDGVTHAEIVALVSTQKFEKDWSLIAHTLAQEGNPRVIIAITDVTWTGLRPPLPTTAPVEDTVLTGVVQGKMEEFFLSRGLQLVDRDTATEVNRRDVVLAGFKNDLREVAAVGARFKADVVIYGQASARYGGRIRIAGYDAYKFVATLNVRAVRTDSAQLMVSKTFGPETVTSLQRGGGREKAMTKLAEGSAPKLLKAVVEAWRKQVHVVRNIRLNISGMDYDAWKKFNQEAGKIRGIRAMNLREITEGVANIDVRHEFDTQALADRLGQLKAVRLKVVEFNPNRLKLKVVKRPQTQTSHAE